MDNESIEYRTQDQYQEIVESFTNGNWSQASKECVEYGFYANDLLNAYDNNGSEGTETLRDFVELVEMAQKLRDEEAK